MIDLGALASLSAVSSHGSIVGAAEALGYTPSAISQQVKRLERQTGVPLLERVGRGVLLTEQGQRLVESGARLLTDLEDLQSGLHSDAERVVGHLRVVAFSTAMRGLVAPAVREVLEAHPRLEVTLTEREPWDSVDLVATGRADVAVVHSWGDVPLAVPRHVTSHRVASDVADVIVHRDHRLALRSRVSPTDLLDEPWIATPEGTICRQWLQRMYVGTRTAPRIAHVAIEFDSHLALVAAGLGIALVPRLGRASLPDQIVAVPAHDPLPTREISALHRTSMGRSPAVLAVVSALGQTPTGRP